MLKAYGFIKTLNTHLKAKEAIHDGVGTLHHHQDIR
jgi:hypothetical protein